jgi:ParB family chromosome partitioning protein
LSAGHARALVSVTSSEIQDRLAQRVVAEGLSVRALEEIVTASPEAKSRTARRPGGKLHSPKLADLAGRLSDRFDTRVRVDLGRTKGKITIEFATVEDLERIVGLIDPPTPGAPRR